MVPLQEVPVINEPYRSTCGGCVSLQRELDAERSAHALSRGEGLHPNQGTERLNHKCIFCGEKLYFMTDYRQIRQLGNPAVSDMKFCKAMEFVSEERTGFWFLASASQVRHNEGCPKEPKVAHLHRYCGTCGAKWLERPLAASYGKEPAAAPPPTKIEE